MNRNNGYVKALVCIFLLQCLLSNIAADQKHRKRKRLPRKPNRSMNNQHQARHSDSHRKDVTSEAQMDQFLPYLQAVNTQGDYGSSASGSFHQYSSASETRQVSSTDSQKEYIDAKVLKTLLKELFEKLESNSQNHNETFSASTSVSGSTNTQGRINSATLHHCNLNGLWLSSVAAAAIQLIPQQSHGHIDIFAKILDLPDNPHPGLITSQWTGKGMISQESPTTLTMIFQEHFDMVNKPRGSAALPRTAVFIGQCLVCQGTPLLQGSWVIFPTHQNCGGKVEPPLTTGSANHESIHLSGSTPDLMYFLE